MNKFKLKEGSKVLNKSLKHCWLKSNDNDEYMFQRYLIESLIDVDVFFSHVDFNHCHSISKMIIEPWKESVKSGNTILATDNTIAGFPSYMMLTSDLIVLEVINNYNDTE